ncbi:MAG: cobamide remodeling phosphodiesterase CbiR [Verrucomicrobiota bacterium]
MMLQSLANKGIGIGCPSWIWPGDILMNVKRLLGLVDDVQLLFFESKEKESLPSDALIIELHALRNELSYSVHLPVDVDLSSYESVETHLRFIEKTLRLDPQAYILHAAPDGRTLFNNDWRERVHKHIAQIIERSGVPPEFLCLENQYYPFMEVEPIINDLRLSVCFDVGHVLNYEFDWHNYTQKYLPQTRVIHAQGYDAMTGKAHRDLQQLNDSYLKDLLAFCLSEQSNVRLMTLEVFDEDKLMRSLQCLKNFHFCREASCE